MVGEGENKCFGRSTDKQTLFSITYMFTNTDTHICIYGAYGRWTNQPRASPSFGGSQRVREWDNLIHSSSYFPAKAHTLLYNARWTEFWTNFLFFQLHLVHKLAKPQISYLFSVLDSVILSSFVVSWERWLWSVNFILAVKDD